MRTQFIFLACLACLDYGRRVQNTIALSQGAAAEATGRRDLQNIEAKQILSNVLLALSPAAALRVVDGRHFRRIASNSLHKAHARSGIAALMSRPAVQAVPDIHVPDNFEDCLRLQLPEYDGIKSTLTDIVENKCKVALEHVQPFGSLVNGFGSGTSDLDLCLTVASDLDADISVPSVGRQSTVFNQDFLRQLVKHLKSDDAENWKLTDDGKLRAKVPVATCRYADKLDVDISVNQDLDVLNKQSRNLRFFASLQLGSESSVADLWQVLRDDFESEDLVGPNFDPTGAVPRRFPPFRLQLLLLEFFIGSGYVDFIEDGTLTASQDQRCALQRHNLDSMRREFYKWGGDSATWDDGKRLLAFKMSSPIDTLHTRDPWNRDFRYVNFAPFKQLFERLAAEL